jgi:hypothetical protein
MKLLIMTDIVLLCGFSSLDLLLTNRENGIIRTWIL